MPENFSGQTYVAFSDLCGFKQMISKDREKAVKALDWLFQSTYNIQNDKSRLFSTNVDAIAVSDCIVSWARDGQLNTIVLFLSQLHSRMIKKQYLLRTTIAYDAFCYQRRLQLSNLQKAYIVGGAYISAYVANDMAELGMIMLLKARHTHDPIGWKWKPCNETENWEYFWSAQRSTDIPKIKKERNKAKNMEYHRLTEIYQRRFNILHKVGSIGEQQTTELKITRKKLEF